MILVLITSKPVSIAAQTTDTAKQCSAQGIYFLTDGRLEVPVLAPGDAMEKVEMRIL